MSNLFEHFRTDVRNRSRVCLHAMPYEKEEDNSQREYLRGAAVGKRYDVTQMKWI